MTTVMDMLAAQLATVMRLRTGAAVLSEPPGAGLAERLRAEVSETRVFAHPSEPPLSYPPVAVVLDRGDREVVRRSDTIWPAGIVPLLLHRRRCLDTLYRSQPLAVIAVAEPSQLASVLAGGVRVLAGSRPVLAVANTDDPGASAAPPPRYRPWITSSPGIHWAQPDSEPAIELVFAALPRREIAIPFDARLSGSGFHPPEPDAPDGGRWTGATYGASATLPRPVYGAWRLRLEIADWGNAADGFAVMLDRTILPLIAQDAAGATYGPWIACPGIATMSLQMFTPRPVRDMRRGPRMIGVRIRSACLQPV